MALLLLLQRMQWNTTSLILMGWSWVNSRTLRLNKGEREKALVGLESCDREHESVTMRPLVLPRNNFGDWQNYCAVDMHYETCGIESFQIVSRGEGSLELALEKQDTNFGPLIGIFTPNKDWSAYSSWWKWLLVWIKLLSGRPWYMHKLALLL